MAKVTSINGKATGKLGSVVYAVSAGQQIAREYNPNVANPSTSKQVNQRAKLKLMSQLSGAMAVAIAIPKDGLRSCRNLFIKENIGLVGASNGEAQISYENIQLTKGTTAIPGIKVQRVSTTALAVELLENAASTVDRVVYVAFKKNTENQLQYVGSVVADEATPDGTFSAELPYVAGDVLIYAYGMRDTSSSASAKYGNYEVHDGTDIADLVATRKLAAGDYQLTATRGTTLFSGDSENETAGANEVMVYITAQGNGTVASAGFSNGRKAVEIGSQITISATPGTNATFIGWKNNGDGTTFSTTNPLVLTINEQRDIVGVFSDPNGGGGGGNSGDAD